MSNDSMPLTAYHLHQFQTCPRRLRLESRYRRLAYHPTTLLSAVIRAAIVSMSDAHTPASYESAVSVAVNQFITSARTPGLDVPAGTNTYTLAMDMCAQIRTILYYLSTCSLLTLRTPPPPSSHPYWSYLSLMDDSGILHRWEFVDSTSDATLLRKSHSWEVFADLCLSRAPMCLHLVNIGTRSESRRNSPWCKAYASPAIIGQYKFRHKSGSPLQGNWKPIYFADNPNQTAEDWVKVMAGDNLPDRTLIRHVNITEPKPEHTQAFLRDINRLHNQIESLPEIFTDIPMSRPACDTPYSCPHQPACFSVNPVQTIESSKLYIKR